MADRVLREPCEHGRYEPHGVEAIFADGTTIVLCLGGREVTIDHEAVMPHLEDLRTVASLCNSQCPHRQDRY